MADPRDKLADALAHARAMRYHIQFVQSPRAHGGLRRGLSAIEADIREALDALQDWAAGGDAVDRRAFGRGVLAAALVPRDALDRLARPLPARVDSALLDALEQANTSYAGGYYLSRPGDLLPLVSAHVDRMEALQETSMTPGQRQRLGSLASDAAAMAGWLALRAGRTGQASAWFASGRSHAQQAADARLHALALGSQGMLHSPVATAGLAGDSEHTLWTLRQAYRGAGEDPYARAWLAANIAQESAAAGDVYGYGEYLEHAARALEAPAREYAGFWSPADRLVPAPVWLDGYANRGRMLLGRPGVEAELARSLEQVPGGSDRVSRLNDLAQYHAATGEPEEAARYATEAVYLAAGEGLTWSRRRARGIRVRLEPWAGIPAVAELDEAFRTTTALG